MLRKKYTQKQIEDLFADWWKRGYKCGAEDQKKEDADVLGEGVIDAYERGYDKAYKIGYAAGLKDGGDK